MNDSYYAQEGQTLTAEALAAIAPEDLEALRLTLLDSVFLLQSDYPLLAIKDFCETGAEGQLDLDQGGVRLMVTRPGLEVQIVRLEDDEFMALGLLQNGRELGETVEVVMKAYAGFDFQTFLQKHLALETFAALGSNN